MTGAEASWLDRAVADANAELTARAPGMQATAQQQVDQHAAAVRDWFAERRLPVTRANVTAYAQGIAEAGMALGLTEDSANSLAAYLGYRIAGAHQLLKGERP